MGRYFCHQCSREVDPEFESFTCPSCNSGFIEELTDDFHAPPSGLDGPFNEGTFENNIHEALLRTLFPQQHPFFPGARGAAADDSVDEDSDGVGQSTDSTLPGDSSSGAEAISLSSANGSAMVSGSGSGSRRRPARSSRSRFTTGRARLPPGRHVHAGPAIGLEGLVHQLLSNLLGDGMHFGQMVQLHGDPGDYAWGPTGFDNIITQLMNQIENTGPPPATTEQLDSLPKLKITQDMVDDKAQCAVCFDEFKYLEDNIRQLPCSHAYHKDCVIPWLKMHGTCPVCRKTLDGRDTTTVEEFPVSELSSESHTNGMDGQDTSENEVPPSSVNRRTHFPPSRDNFMDEDCD